MADGARVLVVEDDRRIADMLAAYLAHERFLPESVASGADALAAQRARPFDFVILDWNLPDMDGMDVCRQIRARSRVPIVMLTARADEVDKVLGLGMGADDYVTKPFSPRELVARMQAILRRASPEAEAESVQIGELRIDAERWTVRRGERELALTALEFTLLRTLAQRPGMVYTREQLLAACRGSAEYADLHMVDVHIANLRKKIEDEPAAPRYIQTVRGAGYRLAGK